MTLNFRIPGGTDYGWIDISQAASVVNRRFYRQGLQWAVQGVTLQQNTATPAPGALRVETLSSTWVTSNAWHKAFAMWKKQQDEIVDQAGAESTVAKFRDFKIFMDSAHVDDYLANASELNDTNLRPRTAVDTFETGEWEPSQIVVPNLVADASGSEVDPYEYLLHMVGTNNNSGRSRGIISGYQNSRSFPFSPDPASAGVPTDANWMQQMFDVGNNNAEVLENAIDKNDNLPYDQDEYPGGATNAGSLHLHSEHYITSNSLGNRVQVGGFMAPCGLIKITNQTSTDPAGDPPGASATLDIQVHLVPGKHRGYLAEPMQDM